ncbi:hypothetical protein TRFO_11180 [Tritrichomonas foetus]|uniref:PCI domain-containing protein n=1 Tax=Tritrichomonas foetus TaxID=1144522 RepID=A0A1J4JA54_9EUKA|nr:hypothetical protein TRFO_11180 [Tritrichomonas foetus]|eukprot:OHS94325.1 hypothetical protein TRFO_11180 [Tritrichomonas foetus]
MSKPDIQAILNDRNIVFVDTYLEQFPKDSNEYKLLHVFSYGTWNDYLALEKSLPANLKIDVKSEAANKLKKLTLLTLFANQKKISFSTLLTELSIDNPDDLEDLVVDLLGMELIEAKIDESTKTIICTRACARCVPNDKEAIDNIIKKISGIRGRISEALKIASS